MNALILLKLLSVLLSTESFSNYYLSYNLGLYGYTLLFTMQAQVILRFLPLKGKEAVINFVGTLNSIVLFITALVFFFGLIFVKQVGALQLIAVSTFVLTYGYFNNQISYYRITQKFNKVFYYYLVQLIVEIILILVIGDNLTATALFFILSISNVLIMLFDRVESVLIFKKPKLNDVTQFGEEFRYALPIMLIALFNFLLASQDQFILKYFGYDTELPGYIANYNVGEKSVNAVLGILTLFLVPRLYLKFNEFSTDTLKEIFKYSLGFALVSALVLVVVYFFSDTLLLLLADKKYLSYSWIIFYIALGALFLGLNSLLSEVYTISKKTDKLLIIYAVGIGLNIGLNLFLISRMGVEGAVWATLLSYIGMYLFNIFYIFRNKSKFNG